MFDHVTIRVSDRAASERFYSTVLAVLGLRPHAGDEFTEWGDFSIARAGAANPVTRRLHVAFGARSRELVDEFWRVGTEAGYRDDGPPGPRPQYREDYYGGFLLDPDGNSVEAVHHGVTRAGAVDHLWIRVADVPAARRFYEAVARHAGFEVLPRGSGRVFCSARDASFSLVAGEEPTENVHIAFPAAADEAVDAFHRGLTDAGHRDNGAPGRRPVYHSGYYGAFVLDPDGNNVELVCHNRGGDIRASYEQFNRTGEAILAILHPDVEWHTATDLPDSGVHRGRDGVTALLREWREAFDPFEADVERVIDRGEHVVVSVILRGRMRGSGEEVVLPETQVWRVRDGLVVEVREYRTLDEALASLPRPPEP